MSDFVIHGVTVRNGILAICPLPGASGDYPRDIDHISDWKPAMVISLTTKAEMDGHGAASLGADLRDSGTRWEHLPIDDSKVPDAAWERKWREISRVAHAALRGGGRVLVHCKGGKGRAGMVALRLMTEAEEQPLKSLARLRALRPGAVETDAQKTWATAKVSEDVFRSSRRSEPVQHHVMR